MHSVGIAAIACLVAGCTTTCFTRPWYRQAAVVGNQEHRTSLTHRTLEVDVAAGFSVAISECDNAERICVEFLVDAGHRLVMPDPVAPVLDAGGARTGTAMPLLYPVGTPLHPIEFVGGVDRPRSDFERKLSKTMGWSRHSLWFGMPDARGAADAEVVVELPRMVLDGKPVVSPRIRFRRVIEEHCYTMGLIAA
jgi:hypothetical protein